MSDVVNLNRFRKRKQREAERERAERNRVIHGRTKADEDLVRLERERADREHAGHLIVAPEPAEDVPESTDAPTDEDAPTS